MNYILEYIGQVSLLNKYYEKVLIKYYEEVVDKLANKLEIPKEDIMKDIKKIYLFYDNNKFREGNLGFLRRIEDKYYIYIYKDLILKNRKSDILNIISHEIGHKLDHDLKKNFLYQLKLESSFLIDYLYEDYIKNFYKKDHISLEDIDKNIENINIIDYTYYTSYKEVNPKCCERLYSEYIFLKMNIDSIKKMEYLLSLNKNVDIFLERTARDFLKNNCLIISERELNDAFHYIEKRRTLNILYKNYIQNLLKKLEGLISSYHNNTKTFNIPSTFKYALSSYIIYRASEDLIKKSILGKTKRLKKEVVEYSKKIIKNIYNGKLYNNVEEIKKIMKI